MPYSIVASVPAKIKIRFPDPRLHSKAVKQLHGFLVFIQPADNLFQALLFVASDFASK